MKSIILDFRYSARVDHWWTDFCFSCGDSTEYTKKLEEYKIKVREIENSMIEVTFPSESAYLLFRLRWP